MWPTKRTAFLVFHGASAQRPFASLDEFVRSFWDVRLREAEALLGGIEWRHQLRRHGDSGWIESYVSLVPNDPELAPIDIYEYYWDRYMTSSIRLGEMIGWLVRTSQGAEEFYRLDPAQLKARYALEAPQLFGPEGFRSNGYLRLLGFAGKLLALRPVQALLSLGLFDSLARALINDKALSFLNDIVVYTTSDVRASSYAIRNQVLAGAAQELCALIDDTAGYERVVLVSHSLGTQIAYDAISRVRRDLCVGAVRPDQVSRIAGLITCGSPMDKIAFLYSQPPAGEAANPYVRDQLTEQLYGFRRRSGAEPSPDTPSLASPFGDEALGGLQWFNFHHPNDLFAGPLDVYRVDGNIEVDDVAADSIDAAHKSYWRSARLYDQIMAAFFDELA